MTKTTKTQRTRGEKLEKHLQKHSTMSHAIATALDLSADTYAMTTDEAAISPERTTVAHRALDIIDDQIACLQALRDELRDDSVDNIWGYIATAEEKEHLEAAENFNLPRAKRLEGIGKHGIK